MLDFLRRLGTTLLATLAGAIVLPLFVIARKISIIPLALLGLFKNLFRYTREAYQTGNYNRGVIKSTLEIAGTALHISLHLIWNLGIVIPLYPIFLAWNIGKGIILGRATGFQGLSGFCKNQFSQLVSYFTKATDLEQRSVIDIVYIYIANNQTHFQDHVQINTGVNLNGLELSPEELTTLRANHQQPKLTSVEIAQLEQDHNQEIKDLIATYNNLHTRLEQDVCPILFDRPEKNETVLLVKYYQRDEQWLPIPNSSYIFDKSSLQGWLAGHSPHPNTRDSITNPAQYEGCPTRYKSYPYYSSADSTSGNSEELSGMATALRAHISSQPRRVVAITTEKNNLRAARTSYYGTLLFNAPKRADDEEVDVDATFSPA